MTVLGQPRGHARKSPKDQRFFSMLQNGTRGFEPPPEEIAPEQIDEYGVDWLTYGQSRILAHHDEANEPDILAGNPFVAHDPEEYSIVEVDAPGCPLTEDELHTLDMHLGQFPRTSKTEDFRRLWVEGLSKCAQLTQTDN